MVNIADVAKAAGVSRSTVSYALSGNRPISRETRERIDLAISELGFTVNAGARALATAQTMVLGLLVQFEDDEFPPAMLQYILAVSTAARELGYDILMVTDDHGPDAVRRITSSNMVDGVVLLDVVHDDPRLQPLREARQPGALVGLPRDTEGLDVFDLDFGEAARLIVDHLHGLGHRDIILVSPPRHVFERGGAYAWRFREAALERAARHDIHLYAHYGESQQPGIERSVNAIIDARPQATALIVHNDASIAALPAVLRERGIAVPRDLSVVSLYSRDFGRTFLLPYTAVETSPDELGRLAVQHLVRRITEPDYGPPVVRFVEPQLTDRGSTA
ncbi:MULTISPECIES: LacI family DNA-binding transcriptional regulator [Microbacterium]|uniref:LacI family DNA-binding transcriptional regulator n=1 Tax=Microbacterium TaxID=33882 RepID=UPI002786CE29|nr:MULTISPECIES: LacI family DNA-binding transcriptional regulator [Microbacterium]MDQ1082074.1 DNA-binding LacI/PurR family transcriptional regulator [Microbacterium sp. SORGH_AS_0344]MDQ1169160.1 DNA-binding LacI/PurR family transcriptional regulator [Microbacterium proteolyticum]